MRTASCVYVALKGIPPAKTLQTGQRGKQGLVQPLSTVMSGD